MSLWMSSLKSHSAVIAGQLGLLPSLSAYNTNTDAFFSNPPKSVPRVAKCLDHRVRQRALRHNINDVLYFSVIPNTCLSLKTQTAR